MSAHRSFPPLAAAPLEPARQVAVLGLNLCRTRGTPFPSLGRLQSVSRSASSPSQLLPAPLCVRTPFAVAQSHFHGTLARAQQTTRTRLTHAAPFRSVHPPYPRLRWIVASSGGKGKGPKGAPSANAAFRCTSNHPPSVTRVIRWRRVFHPAAASGGSTTRVAGTR